MDSVVKQLVETIEIIDVRIYFEDDKVIFSCVNGDETADFKFTNTSEKLANIFRSLKETQKIVTVDIREYKHNREQIKWCIKNLNVESVHCCYSFGQNLDIIKTGNGKAGDGWLVDIPTRPYKYIFQYFRDYYYECSYVPFLCFNISCYDIAIGITITNSMKERIIYFTLKVSNGEIYCAFDIPKQTSRIYFSLEDEKIKVEYLELKEPQEECDILNFSNEDNATPQESTYQTLVTYKFSIYDFNETQLDLLIVNGLGSQCGPWSDFLMKGLYDPRLFLQIAAFLFRKFL